MSEAGMDLRSERYWIRMTQYCIRGCQDWLNCMQMSSLLALSLFTFWGRHWQIAGKRQESSAMMFAAYFSLDLCYSLLKMKIRKCSQSIIFTGAGVRSLSGQVSICWQFSGLESISARWCSVKQLGVSTAWSHEFSYISHPLKAREE